jgi:hypothetical protein
LLVHSDGASVPIEPGEADLVLLINVLHHATDLLLVSDAALLVRPGDTVLIIDLSSGNILNNASRIAWKYIPRSLRRRFAHNLLVEDDTSQVQLVSLVELNLLSHKNCRRLDCASSQVDELTQSNHNPTA